jgi:metal-responsive CopG/Arc/MetJ family transcriptional regulator
MTSVTIRISEKLLHELDNSAQIAHTNRAEYIRLAIESMNKKVLDFERERKLKEASLKVRDESARVNAEFDKVEHEPKS